MRQIQSAFEILYRDGPRAMLNSTHNYMTAISENMVKTAIDSYYSYRGVDIMSEDWDNLIILDACRYDKFKDANSINGELKSIVSASGHSSDFYNNISDRELFDTVCITANPYSVRCLDTAVFHKMIPTYEDLGEPSTQVFDRKSREYVFERSSPEYVYKTASSANTKFPDKRIMVHFMQPHTPYYGSKAEEIRQDLYESDGIVFSAWADESTIKNTKDEKIYSHLLNAAMNGVDIPLADIQAVYTENLELVLKYVELLLDELSGKTVITSDHGELLGNPDSRWSFRDYWHYTGAHSDEIRIVPWLTVENAPRPEIISEPPVKRGEYSDHDVDEQLEFLGYK